MHTLSPDLVTPLNLNANADNQRIPTSLKKKGTVEKHI